MEVEKVDSIILSFFHEYYPDLTNDLESFLNFDFFDSLFFTELIFFLEKRFGFKLEVKDAKQENFKNIKSISRLIIERSSRNGN